MSKEQANAFRKFVNENESVQEQIRKRGIGNCKLVELAAEHGFEFTAEEAADAWVNDRQERDELSDFELEMVSGGNFGDDLLGFVMGLASGHWMVDAVDLLDDTASAISSGEVAREQGQRYKQWKASYKAGT